MDVRLLSSLLHFQFPNIRSHVTIHTGKGTNGSSNGTLNTATTTTNGGLWEAVLFMGGSLLLVALFCGAAFWVAMKWIDVPTTEPASYTARVEL